MRDDGDEDEHRGDLQDDQRAVNARRLAYAAGDEQRRHASVTRHAKRSTCGWTVNVRGLRPGGKRDADVGEHVLKVVRKRRGRGRQRESVL